MSEYETLPDGNIKVPLPDGHHAVVGTVDTLLDGDVDAILEAADKLGIDLSSGFGIATIRRLQKATLVQMVRSWTLLTSDKAPLPLTVDTVRSLSSRYTRPLYEALSPIMPELMPDAPDPKSGPSSSSPAAAGS